MAIEPLPEPVTVVDRAPAAAHVTGVEEILLSDGAVVYGCGDCPDIRFEVAEAADHHRRRTHPVSPHPVSPQPSSIWSGRSAESLAARTAREIGLKIKAGEFGGPGTRMPSYAALAPTQNVSTFTINVAIKILIKSGVLEARGRGAAYIAATGTGEPAAAPVPTATPPQPEPAEPALSPATTAESVATLAGPVAEDRASLRAAIRLSIQALQDAEAHLTAVPDQAGRVTELEADLARERDRAARLERHLAAERDRAAGLERRIGVMTAAMRAVIGDERPT
jgi:hypothetical protein